MNYVTIFKFSCIFYIFNGKLLWAHHTGSEFVSYNTLKSTRSNRQTWAVRLDYATRSNRGQAGTDEDAACGRAVGEWCNHSSE
jgi:hypothetical protein